MVCVAEVVLVRWKCSLCKRTFTVYPDFALPHKRYVRSDILEQSRRYLGSSLASTEGTLWSGTSRIGYEKRSDSFFYLSTVRRWVIWLGNQPELICTALDLIRQKNPSTNICRQVFPPPSHKYRRDSQKLVLERASKLLLVMEEYEKYFPKYFPHFAQRE